MKTITIDGVTYNVDELELIAPYDKEINLDNIHYDKAILMEVDLRQKYGKLVAV